MEKKISENVVVAYKGFDENLRCRGFQYEVGKEYVHEGVIKCCENGFHACTNPFDVLRYYNADGRNRFCIVEQSGSIRIGDIGDTKQSSSKIMIKAEIGTAGLFKAAIEWIRERTSPMPIIEETKDKNDCSSCDYAKIGSSGGCAKIGSSGNNAKIGSSGDYVQIGSSGRSADIGSSGRSAYISSSGRSADIGSSGCDAQISSSGNYAKIGSSGNYAQIGSSGNNAKIGSSGNDVQIGSSGNNAQISSSGDDVQIGSSGRVAKIGLSGCDAKIGSSGEHAHIGSSGDYAQISSSGNYAKINSSGSFAQIESTGETSVICCAGSHSIAKAKKGSWITLAEWKYSEKGCNIPVCVKTEYVDGEHIKEDTWYKLVDGEFKEYKFD